MTKEQGGSSSSAGPAWWQLPVVIELSDDESMVVDTEASVMSVDKEDTAAAVMSVDKEDTALAELGIKLAPPVPIRCRHFVRTPPMFGDDGNQYYAHTTLANGFVGYEVWHVGGGSSVSGDEESGSSVSGDEESGSSVSGDELSDGEAVS